MPRISRKYSQSNFYHVMVQGINKEYIFRKKEYAEKYRELIKNKLEGSNIIVLAYCIMGNHTHFLIYSEKSEYLSKYMQKLNTTYSQFYNKENKRVGYVFRDRYNSQDILNIKHLYNCLKYIHNNPVNANICANMEEYEYSSYNEFMGKRYIINNEAIKLLFGTLTNYKDTFKAMHTLINENEHEFIDVKEKNIEDFIAETENKYNKNIREIIKDKKVLRKIIKEARIQTNVKITELAEILDISKSTVGKYSKG